MLIDNLLLKLAKPAQRAIQNAGITTVEELTKYSEEEILELHGIGKNAFNIIKLTLNENGLAFKNNKGVMTGESMEEKKITYNSIDEYILLFPPETQEILKTLRKVIKESAPQAQEKISWQMPTFALHGNLVHFAAHKNHIGFYPGANGIDAFKHEFLDYKSSKGAVQFPIKKPLPYELISRIVKFRVAENIKEAEEKLKKKK